MRARIAVAALVVALLLGAGLALFVSAPSGQRFLTDRIAGAIAGPGQTVTVKDIAGDWPSHIVWTGIAFADRNGVWLTIDRLEARLRPGALLAGRIVIARAEIGTAHMLRPPVGDPATPASPPPTVESVAAALSRVTVHDAQVGILQLDPPVMGAAIDATLTGSLAEDRDSGLHTLALNGRLRHEPASVGIKLAAGRNAAVLQLTAAAETLTAAGALTLNNRTNALSGALKLNCRTDAACYAGPEAHIGAVTAELVLAGTLSAPRGTFNFSAQEIGYGARRLAALNGQITARPASVPGAVIVNGSGIAAGVPEALPEMRAVLGEEGRWSFALNRAADGALILDDARLDSGGAVLHTAALGLSPRSGPAALRLSLTGGARLFGLPDTASRTDVALRIDRFAEGNGAGHISLSATGLPVGVQLPPLLHGSVNIEADVTATPGGIDLTNIAARSEAAAVRGASTWARVPRFDHARSTLTVTLPPMAGLLPEPTQADVTLKGPLARLHADIQATAPVVLLSRAPVRDAVIVGTLDRTGAGVTARVDGNGQWIDGALTFSGALAQTKPGVIAFSALTWKSPTTDLSGALELSTDSGLLTGGLQGTIGDLAPLSAAFGAPSAGSADLTAAFGRGGGQGLNVTLTARDVRNAALTAGGLTVTGRFEDVFGDLRLSTRAETTDARLFDRPLAAFSARADGTLQALEVEVGATGAADRPFSFASAADISFGEATRFTVRRLAVQDGAVKAELRAPAQLTLSTEGVSLAPVRATVQGGDVEVSFTWNRTSDRFDGALRAEGVSLPPFADIPGQNTSMIVSGDIELSGPARAVNGAARIAATLPPGGGHPPIALAATVALAAGRAKVDATASGLSREPARFLADLPARLNLSAARFSFPTSEPVSASLKWTGNLAPLWRLVPADVNVLAGDVVIDAALEGTLDAPVVSGAFNLTGGTYENLVGGTALRNIEARVGADGQRGFSIALTARDMNDGTVTVSGRVAGDAQMTTGITAELSRLDVVHRDDVVAAVTGKITYTGPFAAGVFQGEVQAVRSLVRLGGSYMPQIPLLRPLPGFETGRSDGLLSAARVDIAVTIADPMRIEGQGLDSVWRGQLNVAGTVTEPDVRGTLTLDRGNFSFLGQTFVLDRGTVTFTGGGTIDPQLNIAATQETADVTATVTITGSARSPDVQLSSRPALPRDEILARLLFRKGTGELGPIESIQLASAASDLAGLSQGGINGLLRRTLGIDVSSGAEGDSLMVGRQFGRNLYVSVGQSLTEQEREIVVEWRLSRSFSLKSTTSDVTGADIGLFWRKDY